MKSALAAAAATIAAPMVNKGRFRLYGRERPEYSRRTFDLVRESVVIDMLGLLTLDWNKLEHWERDAGGFKTADFKKLRSSGITVFHPAVDLNSASPEEAFRVAQDWMRDWNIFLGNYPKELLRVNGVQDLARVKSEERVGVILGFQNADHFRNIQDVSAFYDLGQRISQLTYNAPNLVGAGCTSPHDTGLTPFGASVIQEMNRIGMGIDVSHSSDCTTTDAIVASRKPVLITHANCRALNPHHPRCKPDDIIRKMAARGGVMGITGIRGFVSSREPATIEDVLDHFDHVANLVGVEHLGIGSDTDLDGRDHGNQRHRMDIDGLDHPQRIFDLTEGLVRRNYSNRSIELILGENFRRVLEEIWS